MAEINIYGKLNAATGDGIIADSKQVEYKDTTVYKVLDNLTAGNNTNTIRVNDYVGSTDIMPFGNYVWWDGQLESPCVCRTIRLGGNPDDLYLYVAGNKTGDTEKYYGEIHEFYGNAKGWIYNATYEIDTETAKDSNPYPSGSSRFICDMFNLPRGEYVTGGDIEDNAINDTHIVDSAVKTAKIADEAVTAPKIADGAIGNQHIQSNAVSFDKLDAATRNKINSGTNEPFYYFSIDDKNKQVLKNGDEEIILCSFSSGKGFSVLGNSVTVDIVYQSGDGTVIAAMDSVTLDTNGTEKTTQSGNLTLYCDDLFILAKVNKDCIINTIYVTVGNTSLPCSNYNIPGNANIIHIEDYLVDNLLDEGVRMPYGVYVYTENGHTFPCTVRTKTITTGSGNDVTYLYLATSKDKNNAIDYTNIYEFSGDVENGFTIVSSYKGSGVSADIKDIFNLPYSGYISNNHLANNSVTSGKIANKSVTLPKLSTELQNKLNNTPQYVDILEYVGTNNLMPFGIFVANRDGCMIPCVTRMEKDVNDDEYFNNALYIAERRQDTNNKYYYDYIHVFAMSSQGDTDKYYYRNTYTWDDSNGFTDKDGTTFGKDHRVTVNLCGLFGIVGYNVIENEQIASKAVTQEKLADDVLALINSGGEDSTDGINIYPYTLDKNTLLPQSTNYYYQESNNVFRMPLQIATNRTSQSLELFLKPLYGSEVYKFDNHVSNLNDGFYYIDTVYLDDIAYDNVPISSLFSDHIIDNTVTEAKLSTELQAKINNAGSSAVDITNYIIEGGQLPVATSYCHGDLPCETRVVQCNGYQDLYVWSTKYDGTENVPLYIYAFERSNNGTTWGYTQTIEPPYTNEYVLRLIGDIPDNSITTDKIKDGTITGTDIAGGTITYTNLAGGCVQEKHIANKSVSINKLTTAIVEKLDKIEKIANALGNIYILAERNVTLPLICDGIPSETNNLFSLLGGVWKESSGTIEYSFTANLMSTTTNTYSGSVNYNAVSNFGPFEVNGTDGYIEFTLNSSGMSIETTDDVKIYDFSFTVNGKQILFA